MWRNKTNLAFFKFFYIVLQKQSLKDHKRSWNTFTPWLWAYFRIHKYNWFTGSTGELISYREDVSKTAIAI